VLGPSDGDVVGLRVVGRRDGDGVETRSVGRLVEFGVEGAPVISIDVSVGATVAGTFVGGGDEEGAAVGSVPEVDAGVFRRAKGIAIGTAMAIVIMASITI